MYWKTILDIKFSYSRYGASVKSVWPVLVVVKDAANGAGGLGFDS